MSRTRKDSNQNRVLELVKRDDGTFDLYLNRKLDRGRISGDDLSKELVSASNSVAMSTTRILCKVNQTGKKALFSDNSQGIAICNQLRGSKY